MVPDNIEKSHIEKAIAEIDQNGIQNGAQSTKYDLIHNGKRYPPKLVISLANKFANGKELSRENFYGGPAHPAFKLLEKEGYEIGLKNNREESSDSVKDSNVDYKEFISRLFEDIEKEIRNQQHPLADHQWAQSNSDKYRLISIAPKVENLEILGLHFELYRYKKEICFEIHPEGTLRQKKLIAPLIYKFQQSQPEYELINWSVGPGKIDSNSFQNKKIVPKVKTIYSLKEEDYKNVKNELVGQLTKLYDDFDSTLKEYIRVMKSQMEDLQEEFIEWFFKNTTRKDGSITESNIRNDFENSNKLIEKDILHVNETNIHEMLDYLLVELYKKGTPFHKYSSETESHRPRAILGKDNYLKFLKEKFNNSSETLFLKTASKYKKDELIKFFDFLEELLTRTGIVKNDKKVAFSCAQGGLSLTVGQRPSWRLTKLDGFRYVANADMKFNEHAKRFNGKRGHYYNQFHEVLLNSEIKDAIVRTMKIELDRTRKTGFSKSHNAFFEKAAFDKSYRNEVLNLGSMNGSDTTENEKFDLNQILYGPPGTGKTYRTKELAVQIANPEFSVSSDLSPQEKRKLIVNEYDKLFDAGQIVFTTFHQSFSYEDFIEGIKPIPPKPDGEIGYEVMDGIFKKFCLKASEGKKSLNFDEAYEKYVEDVIESGTIELETPVQKKKFNVRINSNETSVAFPQTEKATEMGVTKEMLRDYIINGVVRDWKPYTTSIGSYLVSNYGIKVENIDNSKKNHVLVIDEINRGNVSAILGELITLLEADKRKNEQEEIIVELPYSKEPFSVPSNVYIIGTMNTADRSVEALDTALRRRFSFTEIMPLPELLEDIKFEKFNLCEVLTIINERIEALLDRDHTIGHSYFIKINSGDTLELKQAFENKVIPLLQEYFYHDYEKIALILGEGFIKHRQSTVKFANFKNLEQPELNGSFELKTIDDIEDAIMILLNNKDEE